MATHFDYKPKEVTEAELEAKVVELFQNSTFQHGDIVRLKGDKNAPILVVTEIGVNSQEIMYQKFMRKFIVLNCKYFNKSRQEFIDLKLNSLCVEKI